MITYVKIRVERYPEVQADLRYPGRTATKPSRRSQCSTFAQIPLFGQSPITSDPWGASNTATSYQSAPLWNPKRAAHSTRDYSAMGTLQVRRYSGLKAVRRIPAPLCKTPNSDLDTQWSRLIFRADKSVRRYTQLTRLLIKSWSRTP